MDGEELIELGGVVDPENGFLDGELEAGAAQPVHGGLVRGTLLVPDGVPGFAPSADRELVRALHGDRGGEEFPFC